MWFLVFALSLLTILFSLNIWGFRKLESVKGREYAADYEENPILRTLMRKIGITKALLIHFFLGATLMVWIAFKKGPSVYIGILIGVLIFNLFDDTITVRETMKENRWQTALQSLDQIEEESIVQ